MNTYGPINARTAFLPPEFDIAEGEENLQELISQRERITASAVNLREISSYELAELVNGQQWFSTTTYPQPRISRYAYRSTFDLVALNGGVSIPAGATTLTLTANTRPPLIPFVNSLIPLDGWGGAVSVVNN